MHAPSVLVAIGAWLHEQLLVDSIGAFCGEGSFYATVFLGLFVIAGAVGVSRSGKARASAATLSAALAIAGGLAVPAVFLVATWSVRLRTGWLPELRAAFPEDASLWLVLSRFDGVTLKAFLTSTLPTFGVALAFLTLTGLLAGLALPKLVALARRRERRFPPELVVAIAVGTVAAVVFPFLLRPYVGTLRLAAFAALLNVAGAALLVVRRPSEERSAKALRATCALAGLGFALLLAAAPRLEAAFDRNLYHEGVGSQILSTYRTDRHRVAVVAARGGAERTLYVDGFLQLTYNDETAEAMGGLDNHHGVLVHPALTMNRDARSVLVLGGAGGVATREALRHPAVESVVNVDDDAAWVELMRTSPELKRIHGGALDDPRVRVAVADPFRFVRDEPSGKWDVIIKDFPTGVSEALGRSHSLQFLRDVKRILAPRGILAVHSDYYGTRSFWTVARTLRAAGFTHLVALNDNWSHSDAFEGILLASREPFPFSRLSRQPATKKLLDTGVLPPVEQLRENGRPEFVDFLLDGNGATVSSLFRPTYLTELRQENGFPLPLLFPVGPY